MARPRKDKKGRTLRKGETIRKSDCIYQYTYVDVNGDRRYIYSSDLLKLRQMEEEILKDKLDGIDSFITKSVTLNNMFDKYMNTRADLAPRSIASYTYQYDAYVRNTIGKRRICDIKYSDILGFYVGLMNEKGLSYNTIVHMNMEIYPAFELALRDNLIRANPTKNAITQMKRQTGAREGIRKALTPEQQKRFLSFMEGHHIFNHWKPIYTVFIGTGLRMGELTALRWKDIDFEKNVITVDHALCYFPSKFNKGKQSFFVSTPKTPAGIRTVPIVKEVKEAIYKAKEYQERKNITCKFEVDGYTDFVFLNRFGKAYLPEDLEKALKRIIAACNKDALARVNSEEEAEFLPNFTCHSLRHTFCARLCENEPNIKVIQSVMGHKDIKTTMDIYAEVSEAKKQISMNALSEKLNLF